ncbi:MAG: hypothetical protein U0841_10700 [Chloroflexia bacterium]
MPTTSRANIISPRTKSTASHLVMIAKPDATAELIDNFARQPAARFAKQDG